MTTQAKDSVVVGSGMAAWTLVRELRKRDTQTPITLVAEGEGHFYSKPMLSNALAQGKSAAQLVTTPAAQMADSLRVKLLANTRALAIHTGEQTLITTHGPLPYGRLALATGAEPVRVPVQGDAAHRVVSVNDLEDYARFRQMLSDARRVLIMGAGLIGCEFANDLVANGYEVAVVDPGAHPLGRLLPPQGGEMVRQALERAGVVFYLGTTVVAVNAKGGALCADLSSGQRVEADLVLSAVGLRPRIALAKEAGIATAQGIVVDQYLQTSEAGVYVLGDGAEVLGRWLPYVMPLMHSARILAAHWAGESVALAYPPMPVVVKTPAIGVVVVPPSSLDRGGWHIQTGDDFVDARWFDESGALKGFALVGSATAQKASLQKLLQ